ncbi:PRC-barrel domain protein [Eggerthellaceae bacterium 3-80]|nr:PRC-barrel domain protein [bacterium D16-34]
MATSKLMSTKELTGVRVLGGKNGTKRIGKIRQFVFAPGQRRCVGFIVKRPDLLWMFHRKDLFVSIEGYDLEDGRVVVRNESSATDRGACKALGIDWDECVLWIGLPVMCEDGTAFGIVGDVTFNRYTGEVSSFETDAGATANALLGKRIIPAEYILGFRRGMGAAIAQSGQAGQETETVELGAILVSDEVKTLSAEGGVAEVAGRATAVAVDKVQTTVDAAKPVVSKAAKKTGEAVNKGAYATGKQIARSKGMFSEFKEEYDKARGTKSSSAKKTSSTKTTSTTKKTSASKSATTRKKASAAKPASTTKKTSTTKTTTSKTSSTKKAPKKKEPDNMFAAFKEEFDKANRGK